MEITLRSNNYVANSLALYMLGILEKYTQNIDWSIKRTDVQMPFAQIVFCAEFSLNEKRKRIYIGTGEVDLTYRGDVEDYRNMIDDICIHILDFFESKISDMFLRHTEIAKFVMEGRG